MDTLIMLVLALNAPIKQTVRHVPVLAIAFYASKDGLPLVALAHNVLTLLIV
jgi:hypothetical protein